MDLMVQCITWIQHVYEPLNQDIYIYIYIFLQNVGVDIIWYNILSQDFFWKYTWIHSDIDDHIMKDVICIQGHSCYTIEPKPSITITIHWFENLYTWRISEFNTVYFPSNYKATLLIGVLLEHFQKQ
jgi:hypothetical protein